MGGWLEGIGKCPTKVRRSFMRKNACPRSRRRVVLRARLTGDLDPAHASNAVEHARQHRPFPRFCFSFLLVFCVPGRVCGMERLRCGVTPCRASARANRGWVLARDTATARIDRSAPVRPKGRMHSFEKVSTTMASVGTEPLRVPRSAVPVRGGLEEGFLLCNLLRRKPWRRS